MGTSCENLPQVHTIIQAFNALAKIAAPALEFKSEAIVHPDDVASYFGQGDRAGHECDLSYNPTLMALLWETLATREVKLLKYAMQRRFRIPDDVRLGQLCAGARRYRLELCRRGCPGVVDQPL